MLRRRLVDPRLLLSVGLGLAAAPVFGKPHPEPRVIVTVVTVRGPHPAAGVERAARLAWGRIVRCYENLAGGAKGQLTLALEVARGGTVSAARVGESTLGKPELDACLAKAMLGLSMPTAERDSTAVVEIRLAPGDKQ